MQDGEPALAVNDAAVQQSRPFGRPSVKMLVALALSLALLGWLVSGGHLSTLGAALSRLSPADALLAALGLAASYILRTLRVYDEFRTDARGRFGACLRIVLIHNAMVNVVPMRGGEAAFPVLLRRTFGTPLPRAIASLLWFRLQDAFVVAVVGVLVWPSLPVALRVLGVAALAGAAWGLPRWARASGRDSGKNTGVPATALAKLWSAFGDATRHARFGWLWTVANWSVKLAAQAWLLAALLSSGLAPGAAGVLGAELSAILPVQGIAGFGSYEAGAAAALLPSGIGFEAGLRAALGLHLCVVACASIAGALALLLPVAEAPGGASASSSADGENR